MDPLQTMLYTVCIPLILMICLLAAILNIFVLLARLHVKTRSNSLELTFSLAASDTWTSIVVGASLFINSYMPVILGIRQSSLCYSLTLEAMDPLQTMLYTVCIPLILMICLLAAILNIFVLLARLHVKTRSNSLELTFSLAASDTWTSIVVGASLFINSYMPVILGIRQSSLCYSLTLEAFRSGGLLTGMLHLLALAICHFLTTAKPFNHEKILSRQKTYAVIILIWILPPLAFVVYFSAWPNQGYRIDKCADVSFYDNIYFRLVISCFIISLMLTTGFLYWRLLKKLNEVRAKAQSSSTAWKRRTVMTSGLIFGTFLIGWLPASLQYVLTAVGMPLHNVQSIWLNVIALISLVLIMAKTLTNPIIYATRRNAKELMSVEDLEDPNVRCIFVAFRSGGLLTGMLHLLALAICHFLTTAKPFNHEKILSRQKTYAVIILIWILPPLAFVVYFSAWPNQGYRIDKCADVSFYDNIYFRLVISCFIISLMLTTGFLYWRLLKKLNEVRAKAQSSSTAWKRRTVMTSGLIFGTFLIGWLPASLQYVLTAVGMPLHNVQSIWLNVIALISLVLIMAKTLTNPIIYATRIPEIRQFVTGRLLRARRLKKNDGLREETLKDEQPMLRKGIPNE
ncbi:Adenosine receptor A2b [Toxocara canis]|uniref:Adenosine receptor A2b n=1 Tax=Toxocara canis TaxID=6265 RepID=A0A0B2VLF1_TOXCA|nr:Adenosine receptor A2b [Toxocara canis]